VNTATKATGAAALLATAFVLTLAWVLSLASISIPDPVVQSWQGALTILLAFFIHERKDSGP
jgi:hypothetical protein